jgi:hypothetical protein
MQYSNIPSLKGSTAQGERDVRYTKQRDHFAISHGECLTAQMLSTAQLRQFGSRSLYVIRPLICCWDGSTVRRGCAESAPLPQYILKRATIWSFCVGCITLFVPQPIKQDKDPLYGNCTLPTCIAINDRVTLVSL